MDGEIEDPWGKMYLKSVMGDLLCTKLTVLMFGYAMKLNCTGLPLLDSYWLSQFVRTTSYEQRTESFIRNGSYERLVRRISYEQPI
jgi:hypothetical protein